MDDLRGAVRLDDLGEDNFGHGFTTAPPYLRGR